MKEGNEVGGGKRMGGVRSETEKERTKMRERQRRAITTNIFHGLRKHGGYRLSPRADINEVLRELAKEAGWIVDPDGTTYRSTASILDRCSVCGTLRSTTPTPTSSVVAGGGGESSTPASPSQLPVSVRDYAMAFNDNVIQPATPFYVSGGGGGGLSSCSSSRNPTGNGNINGDVPLAVYVYGSEDVRRCLSASAAVGVGGGGGSKDAAYEELQEARASNQSTPEGSPRLRS